MHYKVILLDKKKLSEGPFYMKTFKTKIEPLCALFVSNLYSQVKESDARWLVDIYHVDM